MSRIRIDRFRASVEVHPTLGSDTYGAASINDLEQAVKTVCRAVGTPEAHSLLSLIVGESKPPNPPAEARP